MVTLLVVGGPFPPSPNYEQAPPRLTPRLQKTRPQAKAPTLTSGRRCRRRVSGIQPAGSLLFARSRMHDRCMRRRASPRLSSSPSQRTRDDRLSLPVRVAPAPTGSYPGSLAARTSTGSMTGGCASSSGAWAISAAATWPPRWAWRPASSGKASKIPNSDGPRRIASQAMVAGSSSTRASPPSRKLATSASLPGLATRRTSSPTVTIVAPFGRPATRRTIACWARLHRQCLLAWDEMGNRTQGLVLGFFLVVWVSLLVIMWWPGGLRQALRPP